MNLGLSPSFNAVVDSMYRNIRINPYTKTVSQKMSKPAKNFVESAISGNVNHMPRKLDEESIMKMKTELMQLNIPVENIEDQFKELTRKRNQKGALCFDVGLGNTFRKSNSAILVAPTGSGKTVCIFGSLIFEIKNPFDTIVYFSGKSSYENEHVQTFKAICKRVTGVEEPDKEAEPLMKFLWFNTDDSKKPINFFTGDWDQFKKTEINKDGSVKSLYLSKYGSVYIFDDLQNAGIHDPVYELMSDLAIKGRHKLINWFVTFQTVVRLNTKLLTNCEKLFISKLSITDNKVWERLKTGKPTNLQECIDDTDPPRFYYLENNRLIPYLNLEFSDLKQVINKLKSKLPAPLLDEEKKKLYMQTSKVIEAYEKAQQQSSTTSTTTKDQKKPEKVDEDTIPSFDHTKKNDILNNLANINRQRGGRGVRLFP